MLRRPAARMAILALLLLICDILFTSAFDRIRGRSYDLYQQIAPVEIPLEDIVLVEIDDASLTREGRWPWPRTKIGSLIEAIGTQEPAAFAIDILFPDRGTDEGDAALSQAIARTRPVLAMSLTDQAGSAEPAPAAGWSVVGEAPDTLATFPGLLASLPEFTGAAGGLGMVRSVPDDDGVTRSVPMLWAVAGPDGLTLWPALSLDLARQALGETDYTVRLGPQGYDAVKVGDRIVRLTAGGAVWLADAAQDLTRVSALDLLDGTPGNALRDRIVILSVAATGFDSFHTTPLVATRPGVEIHALLTAQILAGHFPYEPAYAKTVERTGFGLLAVLLILSVAFFPVYPLPVLMALPLIFCAPFAAGLLAWRMEGELFDALRPTIGLAIVAAAGGYFLYRTAETRRRQISGQFARYLSPDVVERLIRSEEDVGRSAERREVTVLFMDMRGFTAASERLAPEEIVANVNRFLTLSSEEIFRTEGTIDKFMGDAVMAFWNAPLDQPDHAERAIRAVRAIYRRLDAENAHLAQRGLEPIRLGAGLETGVCSVGNFGSDIRYNYTVIGHAANLASRLETATKLSAASVLCGPELARRIPREVEPAGDFELSGFAEAVPGFALRLPD
ncbi:CHASE2 domain-containing protein [Pseudohoeflea suaedae]|nr:adenylate/guanylate cyclase domain-containing protein [Pseudohoeflea suaedae]